MRDAVLTQDGETEREEAQNRLLHGQRGERHIPGDLEGVRRASREQGGVTALPSPHPRLFH